MRLVVRVIPMPVKIKSSKPAVIITETATSEQPKESTISRIIRIVVSDFKRKIYGDKVVYPEEWETYKRFERLAKGEK
jgi:hypothetical protein